MSIAAGIGRRIGVARVCCGDARIWGCRWRADQIVMMREVDKDRMRQQKKERKRDGSPSALMAGLDHVASVQCITFYLSGKVKTSFNNGAGRLSTRARGLAASRNRALYPIFRRIFQIFGD